MALHPQLPKSPYATLEPEHRWFPAAEELREKAYEKLLPPLVAKVRSEVKAWRAAGYAGASDTSVALLRWWFDMLDLTGYGRLTEFTKLTDRMIDDASKEAVVAAARMLAIQVGHYQRKFGAISLDETMDLLESETLTEDQAAWIADGLENLAVALASVDDEEQPPSVQ